MKHPFTNLPYLKDGNKNIFESEAIMLHIALRSNHTYLLGVNAD
jgi:hypothetical protein